MQNGINGPIGQNVRSHAVTVVEEPDIEHVQLIVIPIGSMFILVVDNGTMI